MLGALEDLATETPNFCSLLPALIIQEEIIQFWSDGGRAMLGALGDLATETPNLCSLLPALIFQEEIILF